MTSAPPGSRPTLTTERLSLSPFGLDDVEDLHGLFTDADVRRYLLDGEIVSREWVEAEIEASVARFDAGCGGLWTVRRREAPPLIGFVGYRPFFDPPELQLLYGLLPDHWGQGLATEAAGAALAFGVRELGMADVHAAVDAPNRRSVAVLERLGMREWKRSEDGAEGTIFYRIGR